MSRPEDIEKMTRPEIESTSTEAVNLFNGFSADTKDNLTVKQAFILGFLHGREKALDEMGIYDDEDDDSKIYNYIKDTENKRKNL